MLARMTTATSPLTPRPLALRTLLVICGLFWAYATLSDVLLGKAMQANATLYHVDMFAPWEVRVIEHLILLPVLVACYWASSRVGWGVLRGLPIQLLLAGSFALLARPAANLAIHVCTEYYLGRWDWPNPRPDPNDALQERILWGASFISFFLTYGFGVALVAGFNWYQHYRDAELRSAALERVWITARLTALRMQLSPHTLFNLLHTIRGQINPEPEIARSMVVQLADLLRRLLSAGQRDFSILAEELSLARMYLELQQRRFSDRLTVILPDAVALPAVWVPSLILQPLVENAVQHGLAGHEGPVEIRLEVDLSAERLAVRVVNTTSAHESAVAEGIGLRNVRERLAVQFGARASLDARRAATTSWMAEVVMPPLFERFAPAVAQGAS
jgi:hypothetical protein